MKRKMLKFNPALSELLGRNILDCGFEPDLRKMFGHEVFFLNGYMFCGANEDGVFFNVGEKMKNEILSTRKNVSPFSPLEGMVMKEYILVDGAECADYKKIREWITTSGDYLKSLPSKRKKAEKEVAQSRRPALKSFG